MRLPFPIMGGRYVVVAHYCRTRRADAAATLRDLVSGAGEWFPIREDPADPDGPEVEIVEAWGFTIESYREIHPRPVLSHVVFDSLQEFPPPFVLGKEPTPADLCLVVTPTGEASFGRDPG